MTEERWQLRGSAWALLPVLQAAPTLSALENVRVPGPGRDKAARPRLKPGCSAWP